MPEVTAEMIERGPGADPRLSAERRRLALKVREVREKLTANGADHSFDLEFVRLYAQRRMGASPGLALLAITFAIVAAQWVGRPFLVVWLVATGTSLFVSHRVARRLLARPSTRVGPRRARRVFALTEAVQGCLWAAMIAATSSSADPHATLFAAIVLLLVGAMNATVTAALPFAVYAGLTPLSLTFIVMLRPWVSVGDNLLLSGLVVGTQAYFAYLARKLYLAARQALSFQSEKDLLIHELEQSKANSDLARRRAEESNLAKSRFLATMSHELRTPLNAILGFSEVMKSELFGQHAVPAYREYADDIHASGEHLLMLINEILDLSRVEAGRYDLHEEAVDLHGAIEECRHLVALRAKKKDIQIRQSEARPLPRLWADARAVRQIALNLLSNAIKFTPQGGHVQIDIGMTPDGGVFVAIADDGAGIPEGEIPVIMSSFGRGTLAHKNAEEGTGLGLPIVKGLVDLHGGTFSLTSTVRVGTTVTVVFPPKRVMEVLPRLDLGDDPMPIRTAA